MINIAIDGPGGAGKSTLARQTAEILGFLYVDTGALYRTVGVACTQNKADITNDAAVAELIPSLTIDVELENGEQVVYLSGQSVGDSIRTPEAAQAAAAVAALPYVREFLLGLQRDIANKHHVIMDGRDIGTVVLPNADVKIYLTASAEERAKRRQGQLRKKGINMAFEDIVAAMKARDDADSNREHAPLKAADDAVVVDSTSLCREETLAVLVKLIRERCGL